MNTRRIAQTLWFVTLIAVVVQAQGGKPGGRDDGYCPRMGCDSLMGPDRVRDDGPRGPGWMSPRVLRELGMSAEQQAKWKERLDARRAAREQDFEKMEKLREDLEEAILRGDKTGAQAISREISAVHARMHEARVEDMSYLVSLLSADQVKKLRELREREREERKKFEQSECPMRKGKRRK